MNTARLLLVVAILTVIAACSSSASTPKADCFTGVFDVVFAAEANANAACPDLSAHPTQWIYVVNADGSVSARVPKGTTPATGNTFDNATCKASEEFTAATPAPGCTVADAYFYQLTFDAKGLAGTYRFIGCVPSDPDAGATPGEYLDCTYPVTGTKQ